MWYILLAYRACGGWSIPATIQHLVRQSFHSQVCASLGERCYSRSICIFHWVRHNLIQFSLLLLMNCSTIHILSILTSVHLDIATIFMTPAKWMHTQTKTQIWTHTPTYTQKHTHRCNTHTHSSTTSCTCLSDTLWRIVSQLLLSLSGTLGGPIKNLCQDVINARLGLSSYFFLVVQEAAPANFWDGLSMPLPNLIPNLFFNSYLRFLLYESLSNNGMW